MSGVQSVTLNAASASTANSFTLSSWSGNATLNGLGGNNTLAVVPNSTVGGVNDVLSDSSLQVTGGLTQSIGLNDIQTANLGGASKGASSFDVSSWTGNGSLTGYGAGNTVLAINDIAAFNLSDTILSRTGRGDMALSAIQIANLTGGASANTFTVSKWSGNGTLDGKEGGDTYNLTLAGTGTGTINVTDSGFTGTDTLNVTASRTTSVTSTSVRVGTQRVNYGTSGIEVLNVKGGTAGVGSVTFNVQSTNATVSTTVETDGNSNVINVGSTAGVLPISAGVVSNILGHLNLMGGGQDIANIDDSGDKSGQVGSLTSTQLTGLGMGPQGITYAALALLNIKLGSGGNTFTVANTASGTTTTVNSGTGSDTVNVTATSSPLTVNTQTGTDTVNVQAIGAAAGINAGGGNDTINVSSNAPTNTGKLSGIAAVLTVNGGTGSSTINVSDTGDSTASTSTLTGTALTSTAFGAGGSLSYSSLAKLNVSMGSGGNTFTVANTASGTTTTVNSGTGSDTVNVQATSGPTTVNTGGGSNLNVVNVGSKEPTTGGIVDEIQGALTVLGNGADTMNVDDTGSTTAKTGTLTATTLTGLSMGPGGITYSGLASVNIDLGSGGNTFAIASTIAGQTLVNSGTGNDTINVQTTNGPTTVNTGGGTNTVNVGRLSPAVGGIVDLIRGALTVNGSGPDTMNVDDTGSTIAKTGTLTSTTLTGLNMGPQGITYFGLTIARISLGSGGNTFLIADRHRTDNRQQRHGNEHDQRADDQRPDEYQRPGDRGHDQCVEPWRPTPVLWSTASVRSCQSMAGLESISSMSMTPAAPSPSLQPPPWPDALTGLNMLGMLSYENLQTLNISLGWGGNTIKVDDTNPSTNTVINTGPGTDKVSILAAGGPLTINTQGGPDIVNLGSFSLNNGGILQKIAAPLDIHGGGNDTLNVDDSGDSEPRTGTLTANRFTGLGVGPTGVSYDGVASVNFTLGMGGNDFTIASTISGSTSVDTGTGAGTINIQAINGPTTVDSTFAPNTINVGSIAPATGGTLGGIAKSLTLRGGQYFDLVNVDDSGDTSNGSAILTTSRLTGLGMAGGITFSGMSKFELVLGSAPQSLLVEGSPLGQTVIDGGNGNTNAEIRATSGPLTLNLGAGNNSVNVGSLAPASGGTLAPVAAALTINGGTGSNSLNLDDTGDTTAHIGTLGASSLNGLGMQKGITYTGMSSISLATWIRHRQPHRGRHRCGE